MEEKGETMKVPPELRTRWSDVLTAIREISGWGEQYSRGHIQAEDTIGDVPETLPEQVAVLPPGEFDLTKVPNIDPDRRLYLAVRDEFNGVEIDPIYELTAGTFGIFRISNQDLIRINEGYEDQVGTDNERVIPDGDHSIVVYMM